MRNHKWGKIPSVLAVVTLLTALLPVSGGFNAVSAAPVLPNVGAVHQPAVVLPLDPVAVRAAAAAAGMGSLAQVGIPQVNNIGDFMNAGPGAKSAAVVLGKSLFWDTQVGSDGQACASCHFSAGADNRTRNQLNPGFRANPGDNTFGNSAVTGVAGEPQFAPNADLVAADFATHELADPIKEDFSHRVVVRDTNDVVSSQGVFKVTFTGTAGGQDTGTPVADPVFHITDPVAGNVNVRGVPPRNTPSVINAVFNFASFWDGRAHNQFNGVNPLGPLATNPTIVVSTANVESETPVALPNSSLASQAVGPPLSDLEMSFAGRTFPDVGKKMLASRPLALQQVAATDSVLGPFRDTVSPGPTGLNTTYAQLIQTVFLPKYWNSTGIITFDGAGNRILNGGANPAGYSQMEANFSLFFGLAIQAYESTLVSDKTRFDRFMEGDNLALDQDEMAGLLVFVNKGTAPQLANPVFAGLSQGACSGCHGGPAFSDASIPALAGVFFDLDGLPVITNGTLQAGPQLALLDGGFYNIGVRPTSEDLGRGGTENGQPLSFTRQALAGKAFAPPLPAPPIPTAIQVDGTFKVPDIRNVELTGPYFHNGGQQTLRDVIEFYRRHGDYTAENLANVDSPLAAVKIANPDVHGRDVDVDRLIRFMLTLTDERVRNEMAPFDHPGIALPNGHQGTATSIPAGEIITNANGVKQAKDRLLVVPAVGSSGRASVALPALRGFLSTGALQTLTIKLAPGWNTLSTPVKLSAVEDTWGEFVALNGLSIGLAYRYNPATGAFDTLAPGDVLTPLDAYYVQANAAAIAEIIPLETPSAPLSKSLVAGWNFVGSAFLQDEMSATDALGSAFQVTGGNVSPLVGYTQVVSPDTNMFAWTYVRGAAAAPNLQLGEGYWVSMLNAGQVSGFSTTPLQFPR